MRLLNAKFGEFLITRPIEGHDKARVEHVGSKIAIEIEHCGSFRANKDEALEKLKILLNRRRYSS